MSDSEEQEQENLLQDLEEETPPTRQDPAVNLTGLSHQDQLIALENVRLQLEAALSTASAMDTNLALQAEVARARAAMATTAASTVGTAEGFLS